MGSPIPCASTMAIPGTRAWRTPWSDWAPSCAAAAAVSAPRRLELTGIFSGHLLLAPARVRPYCFPWGGATRPFQGNRHALRHRLPPARRGHQPYLGLVFRRQGSRHHEPDRDLPHDPHRPLARRVLPPHRVALLRLEPAMSASVGLVLVLAAFLTLLTIVIRLSFRERRLSKTLDAADVVAQQAS